VVFATRWSSASRFDFRFLQPGLHANSGVWLEEKGDQTDPRHSLLEQFQALADEFRSESGQPRDIAARMREARDETLSNRIADTKWDNGDRSRRPLGSQRGECASSGRDHIDVERNQFGRQSWEPLGLPFRPTIFDPHILAVDVSGFA